MRRMLVACVIGALAATVVPARAATVRFIVSNFRFCIERPFPCDPLDVAWVPGPGGGGPVAPAYSTIVTPTVAPGTEIVWTYRDTTCDAIGGCSGHEVRLTDGSLLGTLAARTGNPTVTWTVPADAAAGSVITYYCTVNGHNGVGMNGAIRVAG